MKQPLFQVFALTVLISAFVYQMYHIRLLSTTLDKHEAMMSDFQNALKVCLDSHNTYLRKSSPDPLSPLSSQKRIIDLKSLNNRAKTLNKIYGVNYGGQNDPAHLGGFTSRDNGTISENLWKFMLSQLAVKSFLDIGCGRGISTSFFRDQGARVLCIEGSSDAISQSLLPSSVIVQHDFTRGPWWPEETFDVAWSTEFLEHVGRQYMRNYIPTFKKSAIIIVTSSIWGGWHHVEVHIPAWWIARFTAAGFVYSSEITSWFREQALYDSRKSLLACCLLVFVNPSVAGLEKHQHLFGGNGCYNPINYIHGNEGGGMRCNNELDRLPVSFEALLSCVRRRNNSEVRSKRNYLYNPWLCQHNDRAEISQQFNKSHWSFST